jgi:RNA polymerase sigma factor (sigma-70 family)
LKTAVAKSEESGESASGAESIEELFAAQETPLLLYAQKLVRDLEAAQDLVQEAFVRLHRHFDSVREPRHWLYRTVRNLALNHQRQERRIVPIDPHEPGDGGSVDPELLPDAQIVRIEDIGQMRLCLEKLDPRSRLLVRLKFEEDLSYKEISARTGLSVSHVGYILHHALKFLASELENAGVDL